MWQEKQENLVLPGQLPFTSRSLQQPHWENNTLPPPSVKHDESSRKRKSMNMDFPGLTSDYHFHGESRPREASSQLGLSGQRYNNNVFLNQVNSTEAVNLRPQFDKNYRGLYPDQSNFGHQFNNVHQHYSNISLKSSPNRTMDFNGSRIATMTNASNSLPRQHRELQPLVEKPVGQPFTVPDKRSQAGFVFGQTDSQIYMHVSKSNNTGTENAQEVGPNLNNKFSSNNYTTCYTSLDLARPVEIFQQNVVQPNRLSESMNGATDPKEDNKFETPFKQNESNRYAGNKEHHSVGDSKVKEIKVVGSNMVNQPTSAKSSFLNGGNTDNINGEVKTNEKNVGLRKLDERRKSPCGRTSSTVAAEKLWEGSLQLNSSVTVSAVAFFKSGEKLLGINWFNLVEVKGKVRLEAFEKYIQDLPRSRNHGLMVISLYWKEGSSDSGLSGMKEVSKGYKEGQRVGFAHLSPGVDIYICPHSDTIITILAKYGFFKGMSAVEENKDSMIGCVVWRKNRTSSNSDPKKGETKTTISSNQIQGTKKKNSETTKVQNVVMSMVDANSLPNQEYSPIREPLGHCLEAKKVEPNLEAEKTNPCLESKKVDPCLERQNLTVNVVKQPLPTSDDDDLPEYDFGIIHGPAVVPKNKPLEALVPPMKPVVQPMPVSSQRLDTKCSTPYQGMPITQNLEEHNHERRLKLISRFESPKNTSDELRKKNLFDDNDDDDDMPEWCPPEFFKKQLTEPIQPSTSLPSTGLTFQNMSPDPPRAPLHLPSIRVSVPLPSAHINPSLQNMSSHPILPSPPLAAAAAMRAPFSPPLAAAAAMRAPFSPPLAAAAMRAPFSYQTFRPVITSVKSPPSVPLQSGSRSSMGFNPNFVPRPEYGDRRGWRP